MESLAFEPLLRVPWDVGALELLLPEEQELLELAVRASEPLLQDWVAQVSVEKALGAWWLSARARSDVAETI